MASTTRVSAAAERRRAGNLFQASVADGMGFSAHATIVARRNGRNPPAITFEHDEPERPPDP